MRLIDADELANRFDYLVTTDHLPAKILKQMKNAGYKVKEINDESNELG